MSEEVGIILREAVPGDAKDILLMMGQVNKETEFLVLDEAELLLPPETLEEELDYIYESNNNLLLLAIYEGRSRYQYSAGILGNGTRHSYARRNHQLGEGNGCTFSIGA